MKPRNYQCRKCGKINQITIPWGMIFTPHLGWRKWIKCKHCGAKRHFQRRVFQPEMTIREELKGVYQAMEALEATIEILTRDVHKAEENAAMWKNALMGECMLTSCPISEIMLQRAED